MPATISGRIAGWEIVNRENRRLLWLAVRFLIEDGPVRYPIPVYQRYPFAAFAGATTRAQVIHIIRNVGHGPIPSMVSVAQELLARWNALAIIRGIPLPYNLGQLGP